MEIKLGDVLGVTFGNSKIRKIMITGAMMGDRLFARSINLDGREYPVLIQKLSPTEMKESSTEETPVSSS